MIKYEKAKNGERENNNNNNDNNNNNNNTYEVMAGRKVILFDRKEAAKNQSQVNLIAVNSKVQFGADGTVNVGPQMEVEKEKHAFVLTFSVITMLGE